MSETASEPRGIRIGRLVRAGAQAAGARNGEFRKSFMEGWSKNQIELQNKNISEVILRTNRAADAAHNPASISTCEKDWKTACPDGWTHHLERAVCTAPGSERGDSFASCLAIPTDLNLQEKQQIALECSAPWPCEGSCSVAGTNYAAPCPIGWTTMSDGYCKAQDAKQSRNCPTTSKFISMSVQEKQDLSYRCNIRWPCAVLCEQDFGATCPEHWREVDMNPGLCAAPPTYTGNCEFIANMSTMTVAQKRSFASRCSVDFPCSGGVESVRRVLKPALRSSKPAHATAASFLPNDLS